MRFLLTTPSKLLNVHNTLTDQMHDESLSFTTRVDLSGTQDGVDTGLAMFSRFYSGLHIVQVEGEKTS
jgi:hypothetical protein